MKIKIITKKDFFSLNEKDIYKEEKINLILNEIKTKSLLLTLNKPKYFGNNPSLPLTANTC